MGHVGRGLALLVFASAASIGCGLITGAGDLVADLPDDAGGDDGGLGDDSVTPPPPGTITCGSGTKLCGDECVGASDPAFGCGGTACDRCSVPFAASLKCDDQGRCAPNSCFDGRADCNGDPTDGCEADLTLPQTCGSCNVQCMAGQFCAGAMGCVTSCPGGTSPCGMSCVDLTSNPSHCGDCTKSCPSAPNGTPACKSSTCTITCNPGYGDCSADGNGAGCTALTPYFVDMDMDGHGKKGASSAGEACAVPAGYSAVADDCEDDNPNVYFGQTAYFDSAYPVAGGGVSFDYNCNGVEDVQGFYPVSTCPATCTNGYTKSGPTMTICGSTQYVRCGAGGCALPDTKPAIKCR